MKEKSRTFYIVSIAVMLVVCAYPIYMGVVTSISFLQNGFVDASNYPKYIIPYTPISLSLLITTCILPALYRRFNKYTLVIASILGVGVFFLCEFGLEQICVIEGYKSLPLSSWQYSLCVTTREVLKSIGEPIYAQNNPAYKVHFYLISIVILLSAINVLYGFTRMTREKEYKKSRPLITQLVCVVVFIALCIFACFTAFYRTGVICISPVSSALMSIFFIVFGLTFGVYLGCIFYGKKAILSSVAPSLVASATTFIMYLGELVLMNGVLFRFGSGTFYEPLDGIPFAPVDIAVIIFTGVLTFIITKLLRNKKAKLTV